MATTDRQPYADNTPAAWEGVATALGSGVVLGAAYIVATARLHAPGAAWHDWIRLMPLACGGGLGLVAALLLALRRPAGRDVLRLAVGSIPLFLAVGLLLLPFRIAGEFIGRRSGGIALPTIGDLLDRLRHNPLPLANLALVVLIIVVALIGQRGKSRDALRGDR